MEFCLHASDLHIDCATSEHTRIKAQIFEAMALGGRDVGTPYNMVEIEVDFDYVVARILGWQDLP